MTALYVVEDTAGMYLADFDKKSAEWSAIIDGALIFSTYSKARTLSQRINRSYGYQRSGVSRQTIQDWSYNCWNKMLERAI